MLPLQILPIRFLCDARFMSVARQCATVGVAVLACCTLLCAASQHDDRSPQLSKERTVFSTSFGDVEMAFFPQVQSCLFNLSWTCICCCEHPSFAKLLRSNSMQWSPMPLGGPPNRTQTTWTALCPSISLLTAHDTHAHAAVPASSCVAHSTPIAFAAVSSKKALLCALLHTIAFSR